ncbi:DUF5807 family protein [Haloglomus litoreum]|uniref:DUF5807 family protein n=1 Tax=Haloglomus litoreum TaxID=3034026 RepID=UPI0023E79308|nr:DUF5807 family protein [Haloglomus sp. DT116]
MGDARRAFLAGERPDDICIYLREDGIADPEELADLGERTADGVVLVLPGAEGRQAFESATGLDPMSFAGSAMDTEGTVHRDLTGGDCPEGDGDDHGARFIFAFAEEQNPEVGGQYAEGDVVHAYAACDCGTTYSEKWVAEADAS